MKRFTFQTVAGRILGCFAAITFISFEIIGTARERWAVQIPDEAHTYGIRFRGSVDLFFTPRIGWFLDHGLWIFFAFGIAAIAVDWFGQRHSIDVEIS
jgi:hypothetical protein